MDIFLLCVMPEAEVTITTVGTIRNMTVNLLQHGILTPLMWKEDVCHVARASNNGDMECHD